MAPESDPPPKGRRIGETAVYPGFLLPFSQGERAYHQSSLNTRQRFFARVRQGQQKPERGVLRGLYVAVVRINSGTNNKKSLIRCSLASLIFSTVWGFDAALATGARRKRKELASLYAAYASFLTH